MSSADDKFLILEAIASYFLALDAFEDADAITSHFTEDAAWECFNAGASGPVISIRSRDEMRGAAPLQAASARSARLRHHVTGIVFRELQADSASTLIKVLVTEQPDPMKPPAIRNTALVNGAWRRGPRGWKIQQWRINRDSAN